MSWEIFRCNLNTPSDNCTDPTTTNCISEALYKGQADAMVAQVRSCSHCRSGRPAVASRGWRLTAATTAALHVMQGFVQAGYASIHMDDCWEEKNPPRDPTTNELRAGEYRVTTTNEHGAFKQSPQRRTRLPRPPPARRRLPARSR